MATLLITGIAGGLAQRVALALQADGHTIVGADYRQARNLPAALSGMKQYCAHYNKTIIEDIFRHHRFDGVLHLGRSGSWKESAGKRFDLNVVGSQKIMNLCVQHQIKSLVVLSTFHIYGADPANHIPIAEDEPLRAGLEFPQIADAIQLDSMATTWVYRHPEVITTVLRPTNIIGPTIKNTMSEFLRRPRLPYLLGFNPMTQFVHEDDMAQAVVLSWKAGLRGTYNVGGPGVVPWRTALELCRTRTFPLPWPLTHFAVQAFGKVPHYLINFFRYPCVVSDAALRKEAGWSPTHSMRETLASTVAAARP